MCQLRGSSPKFNNTGELSAVYHALTRANEVLPHGMQTTVLVLADSQLAICTTTGAWAARSNRTLVNKNKRALARLRGKGVTCASGTSSPRRSNPAFARNVASTCPLLTFSRRVSTFPRKGTILTSLLCESIREARRKLQVLSAVQGPLLRRYGLGRLVLRVPGGVISLPMLSWEDVGELLQTLTPRGLRHTGSRL